MVLKKGDWPGVWVSLDGQWKFMRHESDPVPKRWFSYYQGSDQPLFDFGRSTLRACVADAESWLKTHSA